MNTLYNRNLLSISDLSKEEILFILKRAEEMKASRPEEPLRGKILASCFFEPSTRTRLSFESAMLRLGGSVIGFSDTSSTSMQKGESLQDCMRIMGYYADLLVIRHPCDGSARLAATASDKPIINAGDGTNQHPSQTLLDLYTMKECQGKLKGLNVAFIGDLKYSRTVHSLSLASIHFGMRLFFVSFEELSLPQEVTQALKQQEIKFSFHRTIEEVIDKADILYMTRTQKERFPLDQQPKSLLLSSHLIKKAKKNLKVLHPLPRVNEIDATVDQSSHAYYFQQAENGLYVRMALLLSILG